MDKKKDLKKINEEANTKKNNPDKKQIEIPMKASANKTNKVVKHKTKEKETGPDVNLKKTRKSQSGTTVNLKKGDGKITSTVDGEGKGSSNIKNSKPKKSVKKSDNNKSKALKNDSDNVSHKVSGNDKRSAENKLETANDTLSVKKDNNSTVVAKSEVSANNKKNANKKNNTGKESVKKLKNKKNDNAFNNQKKPTVSNLSNHSSDMMEDMIIAATDKVIKKEHKPASRKTQGLVNKIKQSNIKQIQKQKNTQQKKDAFNLNFMLSNKHSQNSNNVQGIIKKTDSPVVSARKNNSTTIKANVIGKKSDLKIVTNKSVLAASAIILVLFICSLISNIMIYSYFNFQKNNPPVTITKPMQLKITDNSTVVSSLTMPRNIITSLEVKQKVSVYAELLENSQIVRGKVMFTTGDGIIVTPTITFMPDWVVGNDGYAYYTKTLKTGELAEVVRSIQTPKNINISDKGKNLNVMSFIFESIGIDNIEIAKALWLNAPQNYFEELI